MAWKSKKRVKKGENKKVKNAVRSEYDGVKFRSNLEKHMYQLLKSNKFDFQYEKTKFVIFEAFEYFGKKVLKMTWLPDFIVTINGDDIVVETKGLMDVTFMNKLKLIKNYFVKNKDKYKYPIMIPRNQPDCADVIKVLKSIRGDYGI